MTEQIEQWICIRFCIKLEHSSMETIQMIQKAEAVGNWWLAASWGQRTHSCIMSCAEFFSENSNLDAYTHTQKKGCPESIQPRNMKNRHLYWRRYKIQETSYIGQWCLCSLQSRHLGTSHSSPNRHELHCHIFLNLINSLKSFLLERWFWFWEKLEVQGLQMWAVGGLS